MESQQGKDKAKEYYDQEAQEYIQRYGKEYSSYPANKIRLDLVVEMLKARNAKTVLDAGAGSGGPMLCLLKEGFATKGFDFAPKMVDAGRIELEKAGYDPNLLFVGDLEDASTFPQEQFDAVIALGVFPHIVDDQKALSNIYASLKPGGVAIIEFRNDLFAAFTLNSYSFNFYLKNLLQLDSFPSETAEDIEKFYRERLLMEPKAQGNDGKIAYTEILAKFHNPLQAKELFEPIGFSVDQLLFYHYHAFPPFFQKKYPELFHERSLRLENPKDWRGYLMASAYLVEAKRND